MALVCGPAPQEQLLLVTDHVFACVAEEVSDGRRRSKSRDRERSRSRSRGTFSFVFLYQSPPYSLFHLCAARLSICLS